MINNDRQSTESVSTRIRSASLIFIIVTLLLSPVLLLGAQSLLPIHLPGWLTSEDADNLQKTNLKKTNDDEANLWNSFTIENVASNEFQEAVNITISEHFPCKAITLFANAATQRNAIALSNTIFGWSCFPTYYGSERVYSPSQNALYPYAEKAFYKGFEEFGNKLSSFSKALEDLNFCAILPDSTMFSSVNPTSNLMHETTRTSSIESILNQATGDSENTTISCVTYNSESEYHDNFYTTDHHWTGWGAIDSYNKTAHKMDLQLMRKPQKDTELDELVTNGWWSRSGLMLLNEPVDEPKLELQDLSVTSGDDAMLRSPDGYQIIYADHPEYSFYDKWYGNISSDTMVIENANYSKDTTALIIGDSFCNSMKWLIALNYKKTVVLDHMYYLYTGDIRLGDIISQYDCSDIYFVAELPNYQSFTSRFPSYFSIPIKG